jgi:uncharacterized membrane protein
MTHLSILFAPLLPLPYLIGLAVVALAVAGFAFYRHARGALGRAALSILLLLALANPSLVGEKREMLKDTALLVIDDSASMKLGERTTQVTHALEAIQKKLSGFADLDSDVLHVTGEDETDLFHAVEQKLATLPTGRIAGVIALTDGEVHDAPGSLLSVPFHALIAGKKDEVDRRIVIKSAPAYGIVGQSVRLTLRVEDEPHTQSDKAHVTLTQDDGTVRELGVPVGQDVPIDLDLAHAGANIAAFEVEPLPGELTPLNNVATVTINGIRDRLRVLLVSGEPQIAGRSWRNLLKADPAVDLIHFTILRSPFKDNSVPNTQLSLIAFPAQEIFDTKLKSFDLVIFDGFNGRTLIPDSYLANIARYVEQGGALLVADATGEQAAELSQSPLARILPTASNGEVLTGSFVPALTDLGHRHPVTMSLPQTMPPATWAPWYRQVDAHVTNDDSATVLTGINQKPLLVLARVGQGRVAQFLSNQFWLWARAYPQGGPQTELLRRTAHWLVHEPELDETALRAHAERSGDEWKIDVARQSLKDTTANVMVTGPDNQPVQVRLATGDEPGILRGTMAVKQGGLYHVKDDTHDVMVLAGVPNALEFGAMVATDEKVKPIASASGGAVSWLADHADGPEIRRTATDGAQSGWGWIGLKKNGQYRITGSDIYPLWPAWLALIVCVLAAMLVWRREGRG